MPFDPKYEFTVQWHLPHRERWRKWLGHLRVLPVKALEIGSYEGRSSIWLCEHILKHPESTITCLDPFEYSSALETENQQPPKPRQVIKAAETRFRQNTTHLRTTGKLKWIKAGSQRALSELRAIGSCFDLIYIDGDHHTASVLQDSVLAWSLLNPQGIMIWDDYLFNTGRLHAMKNNLRRPKIAIDAFLACFKEQYELIAKSAQVCIRKYGR